MTRGQGGGIIPDEDIPALKEAVIAEIFGPGTNTGANKTFIEEHCILGDAVKNIGGIS